MTKFYINQIKQGKITVYDVPAKWRTAVEQEMENGSN